MAVQALLAATLVLTDALNVMLDLCTSLALIPCFLAAACALKLGLTGEIALCALIVAGGITGVVGLLTGFIAI